MERAELIDMLATLQLAGMRTHLDDILARGRKRRYSTEQVLGELFKAEIAEKQARSIRYLGFDQTNAYSSSLVIMACLSPEPPFLLL